MNELITRHLMVETNAEEEARLREWRRASAANEARYRRRRRLWQCLERARLQASHRPPAASEIIAQAGIRQITCHDGSAAVWPAL
jgi:ferric-dicitrate binding protein FerR (iron transport regulator)